MLGYFYESICHRNLPPCGVATTPDCGVLQQVPTGRRMLLLFHGVCCTSRDCGDSVSAVSRAFLSLVMIMGSLASDCQRTFLSATVVAAVDRQLCKPPEHVAWGVVERNGSMASLVHLVSFVPKFHTQCLGRQGILYYRHHGLCEYRLKRHA